jgi:mono/diheme cytochrome c family protein
MKSAIFSFLKGVAVFSLALNSMAVEWGSPDWSSEASLNPGETRENIYQIPKDELERVKEQGYIHALKWPVEVTGVLLPYQAIKYIFEGERKGPIRRIIERIAERRMGDQDMDGVYQWLGLNPFPTKVESDIFRIPFPEGSRPDYRMGASIIDNPHGKGLTFSCAACHSGRFLGKTVMGLTNKRSRANEFFMMGKKYTPYIPAGLFRVSTRSTRGEKKLYQQARQNLKSVESVTPQVLGLDTSLPHVALSLSRRGPDEYATRSSRYYRNPKKNKLRTMVADSRPMPWWNLKYKTRWLADGSIIAGNPVLTNFLWNEIGRGTDLRKLEKWMQDNQEVTKEITAAAFATKAPHWTDFFPVDSINLDKAKKGEIVYNQSCYKCHGSYQKGWSAPNASELSQADLLKTIRVHYPEKTLVKDVGTDPNRWMATKHFSGRLNQLKISKWMKTKVVPQKGYVPPPLEGIFLRYPYFHNNSIPNLCAFMERPDRRPKVFVQGPSEKDEDFDQDCVGYPVGDKIPRKWYKEKDAIYRVGGAGLKNSGHSKSFWNKDGSPKMNMTDKKDLLEFLKTL